MWTSGFWRDALERALKTLAQAFAVVLVSDGTGLLTTDWKAALSVGGMAAVLSLLTSIASNMVVPDDTASLTNGGRNEP